MQRTRAAHGDDVAVVSDPQIQAMIKHYDPTLKAPRTRSRRTVGLTRAEEEAWAEAVAEFTACERRRRSHAGSLGTFIGNIRRRS